MTNLPLRPVLSESRLDTSGKKPNQGYGSQLLPKQLYLRSKLWRAFLVKRSATGYGFLKTDRQTCVSQNPCSAFFYKLQAGFHMFCTKERLPSNHSAIKARSVEGCRLSWPFFFLSPHSISRAQSDDGVLGRLFPSPSPLIAQFGQATRSWKSPGCAKLLTFENYGGHCALGNDQCSNFFAAFPRSLPKNNPIWSLQAVDLTLWLLFWYQYALSAVRPFTDRCVHFQIMSNLHNIPHVNTNQRVETFQQGSKWNGRYPS